jgi:hypothetical protein
MTLHDVLEQRILDQANRQAGKIVNPAFVEAHRLIGQRISNTTPFSPPRERAQALATKLQGVQTEVFIMLRDHLADELRERVADEVSLALAKHVGEK